MLTTILFCSCNNNNEPGNTPEEKEIFKELKSNMVKVEGGTFMMGATSEQGTDVYNDQKPAHQVTLSSFYICKYEVTQDLWNAVMGESRNPSKYKGDRLPVNNVTWKECKEFVDKLDSITGQNYRMLTEAEWEFAARGGNNSKGYKYAGSNIIDDVAWYIKNSNGTIHEIGLKQPNELGLYDMSGSLLEWCRDSYTAYKSEAQTNPCPINDNFNVAVCRGGTYSSSEKLCRVAYRDRDGIGDSDRSVISGFRLAK